MPDDVADEPVPGSGRSGGRDTPRLGADGRSHEVDVVAVTELLGRAPQGPFSVVVRDDTGMPRVIRNAPFLDDGTPMPTRYWLVGAHDRLVVSRLESAGAVGEAEAELDPAEVADAHRRYAAERDAEIPAHHPGPRPSGGVGGTRQGLKCLHAHYAWWLAGGDDPVGRWVAARLDPSDVQRPTREDRERGASRGAAT